MAKAEKMYTYLRGYATGRKMEQTLSALTFAREKHKNQFRKSGEPYIIHPLTMACNAVSLGINDDDIIATILLHDVCEDCGVSIEELPVGDVVKRGVELMTFKVMDGETKETAKVRYYNLIPTSRQAVLTKLIDRCHNVSSMAGTFSIEKLKSYIEETRTFVLPLLRKAKDSYPEYSNALFVLKYHIVSVVDAIDCTIDAYERKNETKHKGGRYYETERDAIDCFCEEYRFLSNFYPAVICYDGITYPSSEAAYQAQKCAEPSDRKLFAGVQGDEAKRIGGTVDIRPDWDEVKVRLMREIVEAKFTQNHYLAEWLVKTGDKPLIEGNTWHDVFWGVDLRTGEGENHLGAILMEVREHFRKHGLPENPEPDYPRCGPIEHISVVLKDITQSDCMCIVNGVDSTLLNVNGDDRVIYMAAGNELLEECKKLGGCDVGGAKITKGYELKAKYIIHAVGPKYPVENHEELLKQAYRSSLDLAKANWVTSIAFPAISTGKFSYPKNEAVKIAVDTVREWLKENPDYRIEVVFTVTDKSLYDIFRAHVQSSDC